jgi:chromosome segregation ATPase
MTQPNPTAPLGQAPNGDGTQPGQAPNENNNSPDTSKWTIEDWKRAYSIKDEAAKSANAEAADKRVKLKLLEDAKSKSETEAQKAETERLKKQGEFQTLAEQREAELNQVKPQLEGLQGRYDKLSDLLNKQLEATIKDWPAEIKALDPGKDADLETRLSWLDKAKLAVEKMVKTPARPGNAPNPRPADQQNLTPTEQAVRELQSTGRYSRF